MAAAFAIVKCAQLANDLRLRAARVQVAADSLESGIFAIATHRHHQDHADVRRRERRGIYAAETVLLQMGGTRQTHRA